MTLLVFGRSGQVATELRRLAPGAVSSVRAMIEPSQRSPAGTNTWSPGA